MTPLLSVENLTVQYPNAASAAVKGISFEVPVAGSVALVGESGSGKSSAAMAIGRLSDLAAANLSGQILFNGNEVIRMDARQLRELRQKGVAYVFQEPMVTLNPVLKVQKQMEEVLAAPTPDFIRACLEEARIPAADSGRVAQAYPHELSGGLQQRVMIAMALAKNAKLLIADEPTTALDATVQKGVLQTLIDLRKSRGLAMLFITHDLQAARFVADTILVMQQGQIVDTLTREKNFAPVHAYSKKLMAASFLNQAPKTRIAVD